MMGWCGICDAKITTYRRKPGTRGTARKDFSWIHLEGDHPDDQIVVVDRPKKRRRS